MQSIIWAEIKYDANYSTKEIINAVTVGIPDQLKFWQPFKVLISIIPQALKPSIEIGMNKKTYPEVRDIESQAMRQLPPFMRVHENTSKLSKLLANTDAGKQLNLSPIQLDHFLEGQFGRSI